MQVECRPTNIQINVGRRTRLRLANAAQLTTPWTTGITVVCHFNVFTVNCTCICTRSYTHTRIHIHYTYFCIPIHLFRQLCQRVGLPMFKQPDMKNNINFIRLHIYKLRGFVGYDYNLIISLYLIQR